MEEGDPNYDKKEAELENEDAEEGEIFDDEEEEESQLQQQQQLQATTLGTSSPSTTTTSTNAPTSSSSSSSLPSSTTTAFSFGNQGDKSGFGLLISGLSHSSASGNNSSREITSRSSERNKKDENRSSSKKSDSKKSSNSTSGNSSAGTGTSNNNNSTSGAGTSSSRNNNSSDKRKRRKYEDGKDSADKESGSSKDQSDENGLRPSKQRRASSREPGEANDTGSSDNDDRTDDEDESLDFNEEFIKEVVKQMEDMLKSGKDKGPRKKKEKIAQMVDKLKRLQTGPDTREMREIVRQNRRLFRPSSRDRSRDRFDRFSPRGFRDRRGRGGRNRERMMDRMIWRERDRDRRDFRDRDRDRDRDRFRDRDKMMGIDQPHHHHHHHHHQSHSSNQQLQSQPSSQSQQQQQSTQSLATTSTDSTTTLASTTLTSTSTTPPPTSTSSSTTTVATTPSSQNNPVIPQHQPSKENDREREKSPKNTCKFYLDGKCHKGAECPFPHDAQPPKKKDICKFYLQGYCGKGDGCLFMHGEFPCKFYHTGAECYSGDKCRFSHEPLTEETRALLKNYLDSGELPDEINRGDGSNNSRPKKPAILGDPTETMKTSYYTWLWQQEMKELELAYTGTKRNLFLIEKEFAITEPPTPPGFSFYDDDDYGRNRKARIGADLSNKAYWRPDEEGPKIMSYYVDTMSDPSLVSDPNPGPVNEDDKLIEMSFHDEDLRLPPSSGVVPPSLPPPMGAPASAIANITPLGVPTDHSSSPALPTNPHLPNFNSQLPFDSQQQQALISSITPPVNSISTPSSSTTMIPSGPPPLLPMQPKLINNEQPSSFSSPSFVNNNQYSTLSISEEMPLPPLKENLPPGPYQESSSNLGPPPPLYAVNSFNGPQSVVPIESNLNSSSTSNQTPVNLASAQSIGPDFNLISHQPQFSSSFASPQGSMEPLASSSSSSLRGENASNIPENLPPAARHLLQRISNNQKIGASVEDSESSDLLFNESNIKKEITDSDLRQPSDQMTKPLEGASGEMKQLLSDSDDDTEDEPVKAALKNLKDAPNTTPPMKHESKKDKNIKSKLDIVKMLNVIRQTTLQVTSTQPAASTMDENKHADFWQNILSGTNLANNSPANLTAGGSNSGIDFRDSRSIPPGSGTPPGTERRDPRLKRSSNDGDGNSPFQDFILSKPSEPAFISDFEYLLHPIAAPKIDYSIYEGLFNNDVRMKTDPRLLNFFKKNTLKDYNPLG